MVPPHWRTWQRPPRESHSELSGATPATTITITIIIITTITIIIIAIIIISSSKTITINITIRETRPRNSSEDGVLPSKARKTSRTAYGARALGSWFLLSLRGPPKLAWPKCTRIHQACGLLSLGVLIKVAGSQANPDIHPLDRPCLQRGSACSFFAFRADVFSMSSFSCEVASPHSKGATQSVMQPSGVGSAKMCSGSVSSLLYNREALHQREWLVDIPSPLTSSRRPESAPFPTPSAIKIGDAACACQHSDRSVTRDWRHEGPGARPAIWQVSREGCQEESPCSPGMPSRGASAEWWGDCEHALQRAPAHSSNS